MTKERFLEIISNPIKDALEDPTISFEEFSFCLANCGKNIEEIEFD